MGQEQSTFGRTVTETDIVMFATMTGASNPLFSVDGEYSRKAYFRRRTAPPKKNRGRIVFGV